MKFPIAHITEKTLKLSENHWYSFKADKSTTKKDLNDMILDKYKVKPIAVKSENYKSITKKRNRSSFKTKAYKIFRVRLPKDTKIPGFEVAK